MTLIEAAKQALEALYMANTRELPENKIGAAINALSAAIAEAEKQEPVACPDGKQCKHGSWCTETYCQEHCEFRAPPQRKPLTDEEIDAEWRELDGEASALFKHVIRKFARAIEAKLKEKNT